ncbi:MAG: alkaline phosphatase family protein [Acetobacteraceae bacterium]
MRSGVLRGTLYGGASAIALLTAASSPAAPPFGGPNDDATVSPIQHVIVIVGENRSFDQLFATYFPRPGQSILNLRSEGIVNADGTPGPRYAAALQNRASDTTIYKISPPIIGPYSTLPPPNTSAAHMAPSDTSPPPFATLSAAAAADYGLLSSDLSLLTVGASGLKPNHIDTRIANAKVLPSGPFQLSPGIADDDFTGDPVHRFYQMWQQTNCAVAHATVRNATGCNMDLFPWVAVTVGHGQEGEAPPSPFTNESTLQGSNSMGFYNMAAGDLKFFRQLANAYTIGDNFHQSIMGGTAPNSIMLGAGDAYWYSDGHGNPAVPPSNEITNPNPTAGTNNWYMIDGYPETAYADCADRTQPGIAPILDYLRSLPYHPSANCRPGYYYMVDNHKPAYLGNGQLATGKGAVNYLPPSSTPTIADLLLAKGVSWSFFGEGFDQYVADPASNVYWAFTNPFEYETSIMTNATVVQNDLKDTKDLYADIAANTLPAVAFVKPGKFNNGHPTDSTPALLEAFVRNILIMLQANPRLRQNTAVFITFDESGGYYDSGPIQPLDFFGDGPRIPVIVVSYYSKGGHVVHSYADQVSILKFIEKNWSLPTISSRSRDNLPNPVASADGSYLPANPPAIDDMMDYFTF